MKNKITFSYFFKEVFFFVGVLLSITLCNKQAEAQILSGNYNVGNGQAGNGGFNSLTAAAAAYNSGSINGAISFILTDTVYSSITETFPVTFNVNPTNVAGYSVTVRPNAGNNVKFIGIATTTAFIKLNGTSNFVIDGSNTVGGTTQNMTFWNTNNVANTGVWFASTGGAGTGCTYDTVRNCKFQGGANPLGFIAIFGVTGSASSSQTSGGADNDNDAIINCSFKSMYNAINWLGAAAATASDNLYVGYNTIGLGSAYPTGTQTTASAPAGVCTNYGMYFSYCNNMNVEKNDIGGVYSYSSPYYPSGVAIGSGITSSYISKNKIHGIAMPSTGGWGAYGIYIPSGTSPANLTISSNFIYDVLTENYTNYPTIYNAYGIFVNSNTTNLNILYNTINMFGTVVNSTNSTSQGFNACIGVYNNFPQNSLVIKGNILSNTTNSNSSNGWLACDYGFYDFASNVPNTGSAYFDYNDYYNVTSTTSGQLSTGYYLYNYNSGLNPTFYNNLLALQSLTGGDAHSLIVQPPFVSNSDLHLSPTGTSPFPLESAGYLPATVAMDIDNDNRPGPSGSIHGGGFIPDIGADEFDGYMNCLPSSSTISQFFCIVPGTYYQFHNRHINSSGTYLDTIANYLGCDSFITLNATVKKSSLTSINKFICSGSSYFFKNQNLTTTGIYRDTLTNYLGCDSFITLNLTVNNCTWYAVPDTNFQKRLLLLGYGSSMNVVHDSINGNALQVINTVSLQLSNNALPGIGSIRSLKGIEAFSNLDTLKCNSNALDSLPAFNQLKYLTVDASLNFSVLQSLPASLTYLSAAYNQLTQLPTLPSGLLYLHCGGNKLHALPTLPVGLQFLYCTGNPLYALPNLPSALISLYCAADSLTSLPTLPNNLLALYCNSNQLNCLPQLPQSINYLDFSQNNISCVPNYVYNSFLTSTPNLFSVPLCNVGNANACNVCMSSSTINQNICAGSSYVFNNQTLTTAGVYYDTIPNYKGCDSIITLNLTFSTSPLTHLLDSTCGNTGHYFNGQLLTQSGNYLDTLVSYSGCDSMIVLSYWMLPTKYSNFNQSICQGSSMIFNSQTLTSSGTYYDTIFGGSYLGCDSIITLNLTVNPLPIASFAALYNSCFHSDSCTSPFFTGTANVASYLWSCSSATITTSTSATPTFCFSSAAQHSISVTVTDVNGCTSNTFTDTVQLSTGCVWPGDANNDLVADNLDIFPIGLMNGTTGPFRQNASLVWVDQPAIAWNTNIPATSIDAKYADCNGDGVIDGNDTTAIIQNYGLTHQRHKSGIQNLLSMSIGPDTLYQNTTATILVGLGSSVVPMDSIYGVAFSFHTDPTAIDTNSIQINTQSSWLFANSTDHFHLYKLDKSGTVAHVGLVRNDHVGKSGFGNFVTISIDIITGNIVGRDEANFNHKYQLHCSIDDINILKLDGSIVNAAVAVDSSLILYNKNVGINSTNKVSLTHSLIPNPANNFVSLQLNGYNWNEEKRIILMDATGKIVLNQNFTTNQKLIDLSNFSSGIYLAKIITIEGVFESKLIKQ